MNSHVAKNPFDNLISLNVFILEQKMEWKDCFEMEGHSFVAYKSLTFPTNRQFNFP